MDVNKDEHGRRLLAAMAAGRHDREALAKATGRGVRTITNWTSGRTMPTDAERRLLRDLLGDYDNPGDPVEVAVRGSELTEDRQYDVIGYYKRRLREQRDEQRERGEERVSSAPTSEATDVSVAPVQLIPAAKKGKPEQPGENSI